IGILRNSEGVGTPLARLDEATRASAAASAAARGSIRDMETSGGAESSALFRPPKSATRGVTGGRRARRASPCGRRPRSPRPPGTRVAAPRWFRRLPMNSRIKAAVVLAVSGLIAVSCGGGGGSSAAPAAPTATTGNTSDTGSTSVVGILGERGVQSFTPNPITAKVGQKIAWRNQDGIVHRIVQDSAGNTNNDHRYGPGSSAGDGVFDTGETAPGATSGAMALTTTGTIRYHCAIHPTMVGSIVVQ